MPKVTVSLMVVRPYEAADRPRIREICHRTGYMGDPIDWQWRDVESFADMWSGYYTDREPESALVVEIAGRVEGYLLGCVDSSRAWKPEAVALRHILRRGLVVRPGTAGVLWRTAADVILDAARSRADARELEFDDPRWPAHLHIDLMPVARGRGAGSEMMRRWLDRLRNQDVPGCHLQTYAENRSAIAFFEACGFRRHGPPQVVPGMRSPADDRLHTQTMVIDLVG
jgi:ribosomal protein S18 acetylase RimI-like enzyme